MSAIHSRYVVALLLLLTLLARTTAAQDPLRPLVVEGLAANYGLATSRLEATRTALEVPRATAALLPSLDVAARWSEFDGVLDLGELINPAYAALNQLTGTSAFPTDLRLTQPFKQDMRTTLTVPLFAPEALAGRQVARARRDEGAALLGRDTRSLAAGIRLAWLQAAAAEQTVGIWRATLEVTEQALRTSERAVAAGAVTPDAAARARADRAETRQSLAEAERAAGDARRALNELVRRPLEAPLDPAPGRAVLIGGVIGDRLADDSLFAVAAAPELAPLIAQALAAREELSAVHATERQAAGGVRAASSGFLPTVALVGDYGFQGNTFRFSGQNDFAVASLSLQWNLFRGGSDVVRRTQAQLQREQVRLQQAALRQTIEREVRDAHAAVITAEPVVAAADDRLAAAARTLQLVQRRADEGLAASLELTDARANWTRAGIGAVLARVQRAVRHVLLARAAATDDVALAR